MKTLAFVLAAISTAQSCFADWVIVQNVTTAGRSQQMTVKVKGSMARADVGKEMSMILDSDNAGVTMLMHQQKAIMKMDAATLKNAMAMAGKMLGDKAAAGGSKLTPTGQKEKIGEWEAEIVAWEGPAGAGKFWVAKEFPDFKEINAINDKMQKALGNPMAAAFPKSEEFNGMVVKSEMTVLGQTAVSELVSAKKADVDAKEFQAPEGYQQLALPGLPGGPAPQK